MHSQISNADVLISLKNSALLLSRKTAFWAGFFYLLTFISISTLFLYQPIHEPNYLPGNANDHKVVMGGILEVIVALCCIISSIILYSVLKNKTKHLPQDLLQPADRPALIIAKVGS